MDIEEQKVRVAAAGSYINDNYFPNNESTKSDYKLILVDKPDTTDIEVALVTVNNDVILRNLPLPLTDTTEVNKYGVMVVAITTIMMTCMVNARNEGIKLGFEMAGQRLLSTLLKADFKVEAALESDEEG